MTRLTQYAQLGTIGHGTHNASSLIPDFVDVIRKFRPDFTLPEDVAEILDMDDDEVTPDQDQRLDEYLNEELWYAMDEFAPPFAYFGAHEGDGSDFGYWLSSDVSEWLNEACRDGELTKCDELPDDPSGHYLVVSDHGNMTLYVDGQEIWGVV